MAENIIFEMLINWLYTLYTVMILLIRNKIGNCIVSKIAHPCVIAEDFECEKTTCEFQYWLKYFQTNINVYLFAVCQIFVCR